MQIGVDSSTAVENKRLFVVGTDEITRMALQFMLHDENETHDLPNLDAAFSKSVDWKPDLLLLGVGVVRENGVEILETIKSRIPDVTVVLVTDSMDAPLNETCLQSGADALIVKPLTIEAVRKKVDMALGRKRKIVIPIFAT
jgi:DNA-binding response OmpR family regulator